MKEPHVCSCDNYILYYIYYSLYKILCPNCISLNSPNKFKLFDMVMPLLFGSKFN